MQFAVETRQEEDGRWLAEIPALPGVSAFGETREAVIIHAQALVLDILAKQVGSGTASLKTADAPPQPPESPITYIPYAAPNQKPAHVAAQELESWPVKAVSLLLNFGTLSWWTF